MAKKTLLPATWDLPKVFRDRLGSAAGRQRLMSAEGHLLLVLHAPPAGDQDDRVGRFFWRQPDGTWLSNDLGGGPGALNKQLNQYNDLVMKLDQQCEDAQSAEQYFDAIEAVTPLHRAVRNMHQVVQEARTACPEDRELINWRDRAYEIERRSELLRDDAKAALDFAIARRVEEQAKNGHNMSVAAHRLNLLVAFFFPVATLATILGMNVPHGLENVIAPWGMIGVLLVGLLLGFFLQGFLKGPTQNGNGKQRR